MAAGVDCVDEALGSGKQCSYSARFARSLGGANVTYRNRAMGGTTTAGVLPQLPLLLDSPSAAAAGAESGGGGGPDLVVIDFSVNDRFEEQDWVERRGSKKEAPGHRQPAATGAAARDAAAASAATTVAEKEAKVFAATEALLRWLLRHRPSSALVLVEAYCENTSFSRRAHKRAALLYGVPFVSYSRLLSGAKGCGVAACGGRACRNTPHPGADVHERVKGALVLWWGAFAARVRCERHGEDESSARGGGGSGEEMAMTAATTTTTTKTKTLAVPPPVPFMLSGAPLARPELADRYQVCDKALAHFSARDMYEDANSAAAAAMVPHQQRQRQQPVVTEGDWTLALERGRADKATWVATEAGSTIDFPLSFGASPRVALVFVRGYDETFGDISISMPELLEVEGGERGGGAGERRVRGRGISFSARGCCNAGKVTQGELLVLNVGQKPLFSPGQRQRGAGGDDENGHGFGAFGVEPWSSTTLRLRFAKGRGKKVAVAFVSSC